MSSHSSLFRGNWYCCICKSNPKGFLALHNPNSADSTTCEDRSCSHPRCRSCISAGYHGGNGSPATLLEQIEEPVSPSQPRIPDQDGEGDRASRQNLFDNAHGRSPSRPSPTPSSTTPLPRQPDPPEESSLSWLLNDDPGPALPAGEAAYGGDRPSSLPLQISDGPLRAPSPTMLETTPHGRGGGTPIFLPHSPTPSQTAMPHIPSPQPHHTGDSRSSTSSKSLSITRHDVALSSSCNTRGETKIQTDATTVSNAAKIEDVGHPKSDDSDNGSVASSVDQFYSAVSTVLGNNLAQDLKDVDLARSGDILTAQLEEFSLRFGHENTSANHLRMMSIVYRHSRYASFYDTLLQLNRSFDPSFVMWLK